MDEHYLVPLVSGGILLAGAAWFWIRKGAPFYREVEAIVFLGVFVLWLGTVTGLFGSLRFPTGVFEPARKKTATPAPSVESAHGSTQRYGRATAVYDIMAHTVYMPDGRKLEAHSGLGGMRDDPRYVNQRMHGSTPPNVYELAPLGQLFYGVRALRLIPVGEAPEFGRDGFLAHSYMLGTRGDSHGCIVFRDYRTFLQAYLNGEIKRVVVVAHLD